MKGGEIEVWRTVGWVLGFVKVKVDRWEVGDVVVWGGCGGLVMF